MLEVLANSKALENIGSRELVDGVRTVVRQPILDRMGRVHCHQLRYRLGPESVSHGEMDESTCQIFDSLILQGVNRLANGVPALIPCTASAFEHRWIDLLPAAMVVLELHASGGDVKKLLENCQKAKANGFQIALASNWELEESEPLLAVADYIKVDFARLSPFLRTQILQRTAHTATAVIAENIEEQDEYRSAVNEGFNLFQGFYFCKPEMLRTRQIPANHSTQLKILELLNRDEINLKEIAPWVQRDTALSYRLLRLVNSPSFAIRQQVQSIESAMMVLGEDGFRRLAVLAITSTLNAGNSVELLRMAFLRARFCELMAERCKLSSQEQYLLGMLSLLPAMLCIPMYRLTPDLPLRNEVCAALCGARNAERVPLDWLEAHERGEWDARDRVAQLYEQNCRDLNELYAVSAAWAEEVLQVVI